MASSVARPSPSVSGWRWFNWGRASRIAPALAVVADEWPELSLGEDAMGSAFEQELAVLLSRQLDFDVWSFAQPPSGTSRRGRREPEGASVVGMPTHLGEQPLRILLGFAWAVGRPRFGRALAAWTRDFARDPALARFRHFGQAVALARELPKTTRALFVYGLGDGGRASRYAAELRDLPYALSVEADDVWRLRDGEKRDLLRGCVFCIAATAETGAHLAALSSRGGKIHLLPRGIDLNRAPAAPSLAARAAREGPRRIISVGPMLEKTGLDRLIEALTRVPAEIDWRWVHFGSGPLEGALRRKIEQAGVAPRVELRRDAPPEEIVAAMRDADLLVCPTRIARDGDRQGLPSACFWAASQKLPILATPLPALREFLDDGVSCVLTSDEPYAMSWAIANLLSDPVRCARIANAAFQRLHNAFDIIDSVARLEEHVRRMLEQPLAGR